MRSLERNERTIGTRHVAKLKKRPKLLTQATEIASKMHSKL